MTHALIFNPVAGNGRGRRHLPKIEQLLQQAGVVYQIFETRYPGHARELARSAAEEFDAVIAVGGDGTIQEVARAVVASERKPPMGVIPNGTGNDFIKMLGIPNNFRGAVEAIAAGTVVPVDHGLVEWDEGGTLHSRYFTNAVGFGFDAAVAGRVASLKFLPGVFGYAAAALATLRRWKSPSATVKLTYADGTEGEWYAGSLFLVTIANGKCSGGGFYLTPGASVRDGMLNACLVVGLPATRALKLMPKAMLARHTGEREVQMSLLTHAEITAERALPLHADGEICTMGTRRVRIAVVPDGLKVIVSFPEKIT